MRNAYSGYTYQQQITRLLIMKMDTERVISSIEIEAKTNDNFDDLILSVKSEKYHFQLKDFAEPTLNSIEVTDEYCKINGKSHKLSLETNVLFFKEIPIDPNSTILGFPSQIINGIYIVSLTRSESDQIISDLYNKNDGRLIEIDHFFNSILDKRIWNIKREDLPSVKTYNTKLLEETVDVGCSILEHNDLLLIEGKPGIGKSHLAVLLEKKFEDVLLYRFWVRNQDPEYRERLIFENFINDITRKIFGDYISRPFSEIFKKLSIDYYIIIIDGLDHVENYAPDEMQYFIDGIEQIKRFCKVVVLSRPLATEIPWKKQTMANWNASQTGKVLDELYHIQDYNQRQQIFGISQGYPILVRYLAEHFKLYGEVPKLNQLKNIEDYYEQILKNEKGKQSLTLFLCSNSYFMNSEISLFLGDAACYVEEYVNERPYLFEKRLNRISLFHDSFNTYLRKISNDNSKLNNKVKDLVFNSIMKYEKRFLSRFSLFNLEKSQKQEIVKEFTNLSAFKLLLKDCIDYESVQAFYTELKALVPEMDFQELEVIQYYDLALIENMINRDHLSALNSFYYTYVRTLLMNGYTEEHITSFGYLFAMLYYVKESNAILLLNRTNEDMYLTDHFVNVLNNDLYVEENFIKKHKKSINSEQIKRLLSDKMNIREHLTLIIENKFIHQNSIPKYAKLLESITKYANGDEQGGILELKSFLYNFNLPDYYPSWILKEVKNNLTSYGFSFSNEGNEYQNLSLEDLIVKYKKTGSFDLRDKIHNYLRLALYEDRLSDISSISLFWPKYYQRRDYSLFSIPQALYTLETKSLISKFTSVETISLMQQISEKEHRTLLLDYIQYYQPYDIISFIENNFDLEDLMIEWFYLPTEYLDIISTKTYQHAVLKILRYHRSHPKLKLADVENLINSIWLDDFQNVLFHTGYRIVVPKGHRLFDLLINSLIEIEDEEDASDIVEKTHDTWNFGIMDDENLQYVKKKNISPMELAKFLDYHGSSFPNSKAFDLYSRSEIAPNFQEILHNGITTRTASGNYASFLYFWPGTVLKMISDYLDNKEFEKAAESFESFMKLSLFDFKLEQKL